MSKYNSYKWTALILQSFTVLTLISIIVFGNYVEAKRHQNDTTPEFEKFRTRFHDARTASDLALQDKLVDGFVTHMQAINSAVLETDDTFHKGLSHICFSLIILNLFALGILIKMTSTRQP